MNKRYVYIVLPVLLIGGAITVMSVTALRYEKSDGDDTAGKFMGIIIGRVLFGPTCPVVSDPPDSKCADKPYATSLVLTTPDGARVIKTFSSDAEGTFRVEAPPGHYAIRSATAANILPYS